MEIIKKGVIPDKSDKLETKYKGVCEFCGCEFVVNDEELKMYVDLENNMFSILPAKLVTVKYYHCPTCNRMVIFDKYKTDGISTTADRITW